MIKMMILAPRKHEMTHAEFRDYVSNVHGPLVKSVPEVAAGIRHYHYNFPVFDLHDEAFRHPRADHLDIVTEAWFDSRLAQHRNMSGPEYLAIVRPDEGRFANETGAVMHYTHEIEITAGDLQSDKLFIFRRRRPDLSRAEFQSRWRAAFTEIVAESALWPRAVSRCVQNHTLPEDLHPEGADPRFFDVIDELFLTARGGADLLAQDAPLQAELRALEAELLDTSRTLSLVTETVCNIP
jgi:hypothetical protein